MIHALIERVKTNAVARAKPSLITRTLISEETGRRNGRKIKHAGIARCLQFIQDTRKLPIKLEDLQQVAGLKRRGLHKAFVTQLHCTPGVLLRLVRLECACNLIAHTNLSVAEIARRSGYRSANSLCVVFKRDLGVSPSHFRSQHKPKPVLQIIPNQYRSVKVSPAVATNLNRAH